ncbi:MAG: hypothetical protein ABIA21_00900 [Candidatus Aenigmatarchaeota archaeon]
MAIRKLRPGSASSFWKNHPLAASLYDFFICLIVYYGLFVLIHEGIHLFVLQSLGGSGSISWTTGMAYTTIAVAPVAPWALVLVALSGGIGAFLFGLLMLSREDEEEERMGIMPNIFAELPYGILEGIYFATGSTVVYFWMPIVFQAFWLIGLVYVLFRMIMYWKKEYID